MCRPASNGDENEVSIRVESSYTYPVSLEVIDEIPVVFQKRDVDFRTKLQANEGKTITYRLRPTRCGVYSFGVCQSFCDRKDCWFPAVIPVRNLDIKAYPSYLMLHQ